MKRITTAVWDNIMRALCQQASTWLVSESFKSLTVIFLGCTESSFITSVVTPGTRNSGRRVSKFRVLFLFDHFIPANDFLSQKVACLGSHLWNWIAHTEFHYQIVKYRDVVCKCNSVMSALAVLLTIFPWRSLTWSEVTPWKFAEREVFDS